MTAAVANMSKYTISKEVFNRVFANDSHSDDDCQRHDTTCRNEDRVHSFVTFQSLELFIDAKLRRLLSSAVSDGSETSGRLGPNSVIFDVSTNIGSLVIDSDRLGLSSHSGFSSIKTNCCVFKGKWQYEVMLNTKGVMQIGWSTRNCQFSQEKGVGDTNDSYAYDGNRVKKWNVSTVKYGDIWQIGDCITCTIDLDEGNIDFYRNGKHLGQAFNIVRIGKLYAYYPSISLAYQESVVANFGSTPLRYPIDNYQTLEAPPYDYVSSASLMIEWICNLLFNDAVNQPTVTQYLICNKIFAHLSQIITNKYVIEECLLNKLITLNSNSVHIILDLMWTLLEEKQMRECLENLLRSIINRYRYSPIQVRFKSETPVLNFDKQKQYLLVMLSLMQHMTTRHYLLNILFETKFPLLLDIKTIEDDIITSSLFPNITISDLLENSGTQYSRNSATESSISEIEDLQESILSTLLFKDDKSRAIFIEKFDKFVKETVNANCRSPISHQIFPNISPVVLSLFNKLISILRNHYNDAVNVIGITYFIDNDNVENESSRIGGMASYLRKNYENELTKYVEDVVSLSIHMKHIYSLLDNLVKLYTSGAHKQLGKLCTVRDNLDEYIKAFKDLNDRYEIDKTSAEEFEKTMSVLEDKILSYGRQLILINSTELTETRRSNIFWLIKLLLNTLEHASSCGSLFRFIPEYFIEALLSLCSSIRFYFMVSSDEYFRSSRQEYLDILQKFSSFIATHFADERVTSAELKDSLSQALASIVSNPETLSSLESIAEDKRIKMIKSLCQPYENRPWAQSNWTLLRFWKGSGFAYRYSNPPNMSPKLGYPINKDTTSLNYLKPYPSILYQSLIGEYLTSERKAGIAFLSSVLCQLNWSFSEFIGMLQEIQTSANRPQKVFIDSRQLKIFSTCFDLTLTLLRVLEMIIRVCPEIITLSSTNEMLLTQLAQLVCQILNRITITGCFDFVINLEIPGLESISYFQILAAVSGILIGLTLMGSQESKENAIRAIITDASFLPTSLLYITGGDSDSVNAFNLTNFDELTPEESESLRQTINLLIAKYQHMVQSKELINCEEISEDDICTICYANRKEALFSCGHQSCRSCIAMHFLRHSDKCFFCNQTIERVVFSDNEVLYPPKK